MRFRGADECVEEVEVRWMQSSAGAVICVPVLSNGVYVRAAEESLDCVSALFVDVAWYGVRSSSTSRLICRRRNLEAR
jgi:hypothetical protein